ncbi:MAG: synthase [Sulfobacillus acidophilus]|uniref:Synthase n=1 Tax=Sulfobacillus acidophilus TaxID=53633 RepID=A0A2T2WD48_9FIRM|nr:MAG: synthase [Sulfobacillus acidophilus]
MRTCTIGAYPKIPAKTGPSVRTAIQRFERGSIGPKQLFETYQAVVADTVNLAYDANLDATTDGQIRWYDLFDPLCRDIDNLQPGGLLRWFDNNFYYRHPLVTGRLQFQGGTLAQWTREAVERSLVPITVALPGPFTILALAEDRSYHQPSALLSDIVEVLALEVGSLRGTGLFEVQWDEPALAAQVSQAQADDVRSAYQDLLGAHSDMRQSVALYWGSSIPWVPVFADLPVARLSVDAVTNPEVLTVLQRELVACEIGLGLVDARDIRLEDAAHLAQIVTDYADRYGDTRVWLHPSSGLELLPPDRAADKVRLLKAVKALAEGETAHHG